MNDIRGVSRYFKVSSLVDTCSQEVVGKLAWLWQVVSITRDFLILAPAVTNAQSQTSYIPDRIDREYPYIWYEQFGTYQLHLKVTIGCIKASKFCTWSWQEAVDHNLDKDQVWGCCANIVAGSDISFRNCDPSLVGPISCGQTVQTALRKEMWPSHNPRNLLAISNGVANMPPTETN